MKFVCSKDSLLEAINIVQKAVPSKSTMPILEGILIEGAADGIKMSGFDLEMGMVKTLPATVKQNGSIV